MELGKSVMCVLRVTIKATAKKKQCWCFRNVKQNNRMHKMTEAHCMNCDSGVCYVRLVLIDFYDFLTKKDKFCSLFSHLIQLKFRTIILLLCHCLRHVRYTGGLKQY